jgi:hypothetical protein
MGALAGKEDANLDSMRRALRLPTACRYHGRVSIIDTSIAAVGDSTVQVHLRVNAGRRINIGRRKNPKGCARYKILRLRSK